MTRHIQTLTDQWQQITYGRAVLTVAEGLRRAVALNDSADTPAHARC